MDYSFDENQSNVRDLASEVLWKRTRAGRSSEQESRNGWFDDLLWHDLSTAGLIGMAVPEKWQGSGAGFVEACLVVMTVAKSAARIPLVETMIGTALPLSVYGTDEQRERLLVPFVQGSKILTSALAYAPAAVTQIQADDASGTWRISGALSHVVAADRAERILVETIDKTGSPRFFFVDPTLNGVEMSMQTAIDRQPRWHLKISDVPIASEDVLEIPAIPSSCSWIHDRVNAARCIVQLGVCEGALDITSGFAKERKQFGRPIGSFQAVAHQLANGYIDTEAVRLTAWRAVWLIANDLPYEEALSIATLWASDAPTRVTEAAMHVHGGTSVDLDYPIHRYYLQAKSTALLLGGPGRRLGDLADSIAGSAC